MATITFTINGRRQTVDVSPQMPCYGYCATDLILQAPSLVVGLARAEPAPSISKARRCAPAAHRCLPSPIRR
jgi:hypothetical protein